MVFLRWLKALAPPTSHGHLSAAQPEFTLTAVLIGLAIGCLICFTNLSLGLQSGWISMMSIQSALIGFLISRMLPTPLSPQEIIIVQTTAVATGTMPLAAGFVGILPALGLLSEERDGTPPIHLGWWAALGWSCSIAFFGVFLSPPLRKHVIIEEQLPFPSGTATAQLISVLHKLPPPETGVRHRHGYREVSSEEPGDQRESVNAEVPREGQALVNDQDGREREIVQHDGWHDLIWSFGAAAGLTLFAYFFPTVFTIPIFGIYLAKEWLWYFTPSLSYVGQGIIMGFPTTVSMNLGMLVGWAVLSPLSKLSGWAPGPVGDMSNGARGWILWISLGIMCADSLVSLIPVVLDSAKDYIVPLRRHYSEIGNEAPKRENHETETEDRLVPRSWVLIGLLASIVIGTWLVWLVFGHEGIKPWATVLGFMLGGLLSVIGVRALGETDLNPVSGLGKISQLLFAWIQPGNIVANIIAGGVAEAGAQQAGDLMQDLKTGHLVHASPRAQFYGQLIGSSVSIVVTTTAFTLYKRAYQIPGPSFPAPTAYVWLGLARLLRDGQLPANSAKFMIAFSAIFGALSGLKSYASRRQLRYSKWIPSGVAFAIGFLNTPSFSIARLIGGVIEYVYRTRYAKKDGGDIRLVVIASGFVLGEGVISIVSLVLKILGVGVASCWGCGHGLCGGCPAP
ncbi:oligonucleotide transporter [Coprinopsis marcescibilis]|uniref:Oligonucleotide transporter n=1 Tax=Coprinopsis marcescibilis TaxID=230819 RepID=A0A5C3KJE0_COPMA|nr:oligonucleotide transporter [Coprinopsis marcescibilis]